MERAVDQLISAIEAALTDVARERIGRLHRDDDADDPEVVFARHAWLFGPSARDLIGEVQERGMLVEPLRSAVFGHLARLARERTLVPMRRSLSSLMDRPLGLPELDVSLHAGLRELEGGGENGRLVALERGIVRVAARIRGPMEARLAEAHEAERVFRSRAQDDVDRIEPEVEKRALALLGETDDLADEVLDFLRGRIGGELRTPFALLRALRAPELDDLVPLRSRSTRIAELVRPARLDERLARRVHIETASGRILVPAEMVLLTADDVRIVPSGGPGIGSEIDLLEATGRAMAVIHAHPGAPSPLRRPRLGVLGRIFGTTLARAAFEPRALARPGGIPVPILDRGRRIAAATMLFRLRSEAARTLASSGHDASTTLGRALRMEVEAPLAELLALSERASVRFDALRLGLALHRAMRERFDEDYLRGRDAPEVLRSMLARVTVEPPSRFALEVGADDGVDRELRGFFEGKLR